MLNLYWSIHCVALDYVALDGECVFSVGQIQSCFDVITLDDSTVEGVEFFIIAISMTPPRDGVKLAPAATRIRIIDDEGKSP